MARRRLLHVCLVTLGVAAFGAWLAGAPAPVAGTISTFAGTGTAGSTGNGGAATSARVNLPSGLAVDSSGNLYIADAGNHMVRRVDATTGIITTVAGTGSVGSTGDGGAATSARLNGPTSLAFDSSGNLFIADRGNHRIRRVAAGTGVITTVAGAGGSGSTGDGGAATTALLNGPMGVATDTSGNIFIADYGNNKVRKVTVATGIITTVAGTGFYGLSGDGGAATAAAMREPSSVAVASDGTFYIADYSNYRVRRVDGTTGVITTIAGVLTNGFNGENGLATNAKLDSPRSLYLDGRGNLLIADDFNNRIRQIALGTGIITTVAGNGTAGVGGDGGQAQAALLSQPSGVAADARGNIYIGDTNNHRVRKVTTPTTPTRVMSTLAGTGVQGFSGTGGAATSAQLAFPTGVAVDSNGHVFIADSVNGRVRRVDGATGIITTVAGIGEQGSTGDNGLATNARVEALAVAVDTSGNLYLMDQVNRRIRKVAAADGIITTVAGNGTEGTAEGVNGDGGAATSASFVLPADVAVDTAGNIYIADRSGHKIRKVTVATGVISTVAGTGTFGFSGDSGPATVAQLNDPTGIAVDTDGNLYIVDRGNNRVRKVTVATGVITTIAGTGTAGYSGESLSGTLADLNQPFDVAVDASGNVYVADAENERIRMITPGGIISTVAGATTMAASELSADSFGGDGGAATAALMRQPRGIAVDSQGSLYIADDVDHRVRKAGNPPQFTTQPVDVSTSPSTTATFTAAATGSPTYQWQVSSDSGVTWTDLTAVSPYSGITTGTLTVNPTTLGLNGLQYRLGATNAIATSYSTAATLSVATPTAPSFSSHPSSVAVAAGANPSFTVVATGSPTPTVLWQVSTDGGATFTNMTDVPPYTGSATSTLAITNAPHQYNNYRYRAVATNSVSSVNSNPAVLTVRGAMTASPSTLRFSATKVSVDGALTSSTPAQAVTVSFAGAGSAWTATASESWMLVSNGSANGDGQFTVSIQNPSNVIGGSTTLSGFVTLSAPTSSTTSVSVPVNLSVVFDGTATTGPFGQVDTPAQSATGVQGAIGVTGWALDDVGVASVKIYRNCLAFDDPASCQTILSGTPQQANVVFVGDAAFLAGARTDVEAAYSTLPLANRAGWGYLMLTPMLPHVTNALGFGGQGPLTVYAVATDVEGNQSLLGRSADPASPDLRTPTAITMDNDAIAKPFGAIDTPGQGATVSGVLANFGWALTPDSNTTGGEVGDILIPTNGSTMTVFIDSVPVAQVTYNQCRGTVGNPAPDGVFCNDDVANIFGNLAPAAALSLRTSNPTKHRNLDAGRSAIGSYAFDTSSLTNGLHTIAWSVTDSASRTEGIGSRFFNVLNGLSGDTTSGIVSGTFTASPTRTSGIVSGIFTTETMPEVLDTTLRNRPAEVRGPAWVLGFMAAGTDGVWVRTGFDLTQSWTDLPRDAEGRRVVEIASGSRVELWLGAAADRGFLVANGTLRDLPPGATLRGAQFAWAPPVGYVGEYLLSFMRGSERVDVTIVVK
jgi:hypothetical protein